MAVTDPPIPANTPNNAAPIDYSPYLAMDPVAIYAQFGNGLPANWNWSEYQRQRNLQANPAGSGQSTYNPAAYTDPAARQAAWIAAGKPVKGFDPRYGEVDLDNRGDDVMAAFRGSGITDPFSYAVNPQSGIGNGNDMLAQFIQNAPWAAGKTPEQIRQQLATITQRDYNAYDPTQRSRIKALVGDKRADMVWDPRDVDYALWDFIDNAPWTSGKDETFIRQQLNTINQNDLNAYSPEQRNRIKTILGAGRQDLKWDGTSTTQPPPGGPPGGGAPAGTGNSTLGQAGGSTNVGTGSAATPSAAGGGFSSGIGTGSPSAGGGPNMMGGDPRAHGSGMQAFAKGGRVRERPAAPMVLADNGDAGPAIYYKPKPMRPKKMSKGGRMRKGYADGGRVSYEDYLMAARSMGTDTRTDDAGTHQATIGREEWDRLPVSEQVKQITGGGSTFAGGYWNQDSDFVKGLGAKFKEKFGAPPADWFGEGAGKWNTGDRDYQNQYRGYSVSATPPDLSKGFDPARVFHDPETGLYIYERENSMKPDEIAGLQDRQSQGQTNLMIAGLALVAGGGMFMNAMMTGSPFQVAQAAAAGQYGPEIALEIQLFGGPEAVATTFEGLTEAQVQQLLTTGTIGEGPLAAAATAAPETWALTEGFAETIAEQIAQTSTATSSLTTQVAAEITAALSSAPPSFWTQFATDPMAALRSLPGRVGQWALSNPGDAMRFGAGLVGAFSSGGGGSGGSVTSPNPVGGPGTSNTDLMNQIIRDLYDEDQRLYKPLRERVVGEAMDRGGESDQQQSASRAIGTVATTFDAARGSAGRDMRRVGAAPTANFLARSRVDEGLARAIAGTGAIDRATEEGRRLRSTLATASMGNPAAVLNLTRQRDLDDQAAIDRDRRRNQSDDQIDQEELARFGRFAGYAGDALGRGGAFDGFSDAARSWFGASGGRPELPPGAAIPMPAGAPPPVPPPMPGPAAAAPPGLPPGASVLPPEAGRVEGPGTPTSDSVPAQLSVEEGVLNAEAMKVIDTVSPGLFEGLNKVGMALRKMGVSV